MGNPDRRIMESQGKAMGRRPKGYFINYQLSIINCQRQTGVDALCQPWRV